MATKAWNDWSQKASDGVSWKVAKASVSELAEEDEATDAEHNSDGIHWVFKEHICAIKGWAQSRLA
eukprot:9863294-Alexandrium_andersonii.AAC.1